MRTAENCHVAAGTGGQCSAEQVVERVPGQRRRIDRGQYLALSAAAIVHVGAAFLADVDGDDGDALVLDDAPQYGTDLAAEHPGEGDIETQHRRHPGDPVTLTARVYVQFGTAVGGSVEGYRQ